MSVSNYLHVKQTPTNAAVRNDILVILSHHRQGLTLSEVSSLLGIREGCSQDTIHQHLKYCAKHGKVGILEVPGRGAVYKFYGFFRERNVS
jgi:Fe2+ or Zn2+ uptake regulation protein